MHGLHIVALLVAAETATGEPAATGMPVQIEIAGTTVFSAEELARALGPRLPPGMRMGKLSVSMRPDGLLELTWQSRKRVVELGDESGGAAARVVALLAADLLPVTVPTPPAEVVTVPARAHEPASLVSLAAGYGLWSGSGGSPLQGVTLTAGLDREHLRLRAQAGWLGGTARPLLDMRAWPLRFGAGLGTSYVSLLGSLVMVPYELAGVANLTRTLVGGGVGLETRFFLGWGFALQLQAGIDLYVSKRLEVATSGVNFFASPSWAVAFGAGLAWGRVR